MRTTIVTVTQTQQGVISKYSASGVSEAIPRWTKRLPSTPCSYYDFIHSSYALVPYQKCKADCGAIGSAYFGTQYGQEVRRVSSFLATQTEESSHPMVDGEWVQIQQ